MADNESSNGETQLTKDSLILANVVKVTDSTLYSQVPFLFDNDHQYLNVMLHYMSRQYILRVFQI